MKCMLMFNQPNSKIFFCKFTNFKMNSILITIRNVLCCCFKDKSNPDELLPLKPSQNHPISNNYSREKENPLTSTLLASAKPDQPFFEPSIEQIIDQISSGDDDDPIDPAQEEKYEQILKGIED